MSRSKQRILSVFLIIMMVFTLAGCAKSPNEDTAVTTDQVEKAGTSFTPGEYTAKKDGKDGPIEVKVVFDEKSIVSVTIGENNETKGISDEAFVRIPKAIVDNQTLAVDAVSGASLTSNAIIEGVKDCVVQAGGNVDDLLISSETEENLETIEKTCDIVIVGAGASGLTAAMSATELGAKVLVIEKGINAAVSNGANAGGPIAAGTKVQQAEGENLSVETLYTHMSNFANSTINDLLLKNVLSLTGETIDKLDDLGLNVYLRGDAYGVGFRARHGIKERGLDRTNPETELIEASGGEFMYETTGEKIITDESGKVIGLEAMRADGTKVVIHAKAVLMATGGYLGSSEMIKEKFGDVTVNPLGNTLSTGDGIKMALEVGGVEDRNWGIVANEFSATNAKAGTWSFDSNQNLRFGIYGGLLVNKEGNRFFNEEIMASTPLCGAESTLRQGKYYAIVDDAYYKSVGTVGIFETLGSPQVWEAGVRNLSASAPESRAQVKILTEAQNQLDEAITQGWAYKADTIEELAAYFDLENLGGTVAQYNQMCVDGIDAQFYKDEAFMTPINQGPYYVFEYEPSAWCTIGGVKVDDQLRILNQSNEPIEGLFAAGLDAGSMFTSPYYDNEGSAFGLSLASGTLAGRIMVEYINQ